MMDFMDSLRRGVDRAGFELDRFLRANRVRSQIGGLRSRVDEETRQIGLHLFELYQRGESIPEELRGHCEQIKQYQAEIAQREAELEAINREAAPQGEQEPFEAERPEAGTCPSCGESLPAAAVYCPRCGVNLQAVSHTPPTPPDQPA